ncbi:MULTISPECIES: helix-turn-helix domain-containing protein [Kordiimonas]|uniref:helix-turn-helix domain-containing protein n=1 Tax=Kordiimonas TaxID=288021 RepID=UPI002579CD6B|nr:AraC family transcriptional regulator [Kordiimonas sp. UBA4487]
METLDDIIRYNAVGMLVWLSVLMVRDFCDRLACWLGSLSAICSAAYLLASKPGLTLFGVDADYLFFPFAFISPVAAWLFSLSQFDDHFRIRRWHVAVAVAKVVTGGVAFYEWQQLEGMTLHTQMTVAGALTIAIVIGILAHLTYVAWRGRNDDLVEARRRFRTVFVSGVIIISAGVMVAEVFLIGYGFEPYLLLLQSSSFLAIALYLHWRLTASGGQDLFFVDKRPVTVPEVRPSNGNGDAADAVDLAVIRKLEDTGFILEPSLTIARMAEQAGMPEHRLRRLINQGMGYRNFADYVNHHRIAVAQERLASVEDRNLPVLTIAMDLGYGSLGPFNRAFKERTGQTPTEYRKNTIAAT